MPEQRFRERGAWCYANGGGRLCLEQCLREHGDGAGVRGDVQGDERATVNTPSVPMLTVAQRPAPPSDLRVPVDSPGVSAALFAGFSLVFAHVVLQQLQVALGHRGQRAVGAFDVAQLHVLGAFKRDGHNLAAV